MGNKPRLGQACHQPGASLLWPEIIEATLGKRFCSKAHAQKEVYRHISTSTTAVVDDIILKLVENKDECN